MNSLKLGARCHAVESSYCASSSQGCNHEFSEPSCVRHETDARFGWKLPNDVHSRALVVIHEVGLEELTRASVVRPASTNYTRNGDDCVRAREVDGLDAVFADRRNQIADE